MTEDLIERLDQFRSDAPGVPMKSAADVRRRGDQIRRRTHILTTAGAAAVVAVVVAPVLALTGGTGSRHIDPAPQPASSSVDGRLPTLSASNLLSKADAEKEGPWTVTSTVAGDGQDSWHPCASQAFSSLGARSVFRREMEHSHLGAGAPADVRLDQSIGEFGSPGAAAAAYRRIAKMWTDCDATLAKTASVTNSPVHRFGTKLPVPGTRLENRFTVKYDQDQGAGLERTWFIDTGLVRSGSRVSVVSYWSNGVDFSGPALATFIPLSAERLVNGGGTETVRSGGVEASPTSASSVPPPPTSSLSGPPAPAKLSDANLPAAGDLPRLDRFQSTLGWNRYSPTPEVPTLACQKEWLSALPPAEKVTSDYRWDSDSAMVGQIHVAVLEFGDQDAEQSAYSALTQWQEVCPAAQVEQKPQVSQNPHDVGTSIRLGLDRASQSQTTYADPNSTNGDATWFETELVAEKGTRLVLVGYGELAGPCPPSTGDKFDPCYQPDQPDSWPGRILAIEKAAVAAGIKD